MVCIGLVQTFTFTMQYRAEHLPKANAGKHNATVASGRLACVAALHQAKLTRDVLFVSD